MASDKQVSGTFGATGQSITLRGRYLSVDLDFGSGTVAVQRDLLGDGNWFTVTDASGTAASYTADQSVNLDSLNPCLWRLNCTAYTSTITYRAVAR